MELEIYQVAILLTTLFSGSDAGPAASRQTSTTRLQSVENAPSHKLQEYSSLRQGPFNKRPPVVEKVLQSSTERRAVMHRLAKTGQLRAEFFFPSEKGLVMQKRNTITQKNLDFSEISQRKVTSKIVKVAQRRRFRRFVAQGSKWPVDSSGKITWRVTDWSAKLSNTDVNNTLTQAFRIWAEVSVLTFRWVDPPAKADITILFAQTAYHPPCSKPFDKAGGALAHAYYPNSPGDKKGDIHFDDAEAWNTAALLLAAVHEIGHSLGLRHSTVPGSSMYPNLPNPSTITQTHVVLSDDDVKGIRSIYGYCQPKVTAIESWMGNGRTYVFNRNRYWRMNDPKQESDRGYPKSMSWGWPGVPDDIDEVFLWGHNWYTYVFKGSHYAKLDNSIGQVLPGYPRTIASGWPGLPTTGIDAAMTWINGVSYFFKGDKVYKYDNNNDQVDTVDLISKEFPGLPNNLDSAFRWYYDGHVYFFKDDHYYTWDYANHQVGGTYKIGNTRWMNLCNV